MPRIDKNVSSVERAKRKEKKRKEVTACGRVRASWGAACGAPTKDSFAPSGGGVRNAKRERRRGCYWDIFAGLGEVGGRVEDYFGSHKLMFVLSHLCSAKDGAPDVCAPAKEKQILPLPLRCTQSQGQDDSITTKAIASDGLRSFLYRMARGCSATGPGLSRWRRPSGGRIPGR